MVKIERSYPAPKSLAEEARKTNGRYDSQDVIDQLKKDFHNKCYICEIKELQDPNVEHLLPDKNGRYPERKVDWEKRFW
ncbi:MAG: HNH endonuclease, partial [Acetatifactor sp.]|nr:HNH endonuclease [Acetatifactor sp.]